MIFDRLFEARATAEYARTTLKEPASWIETWFGGPETYAGPRVTEETALAHHAVGACVRVLAETLSTLRIHVVQRLEPRGRRRLDSHPLNDVLNVEANPDATARTARAAVQAHISTNGNAYAPIRFDRNARPIGYDPIQPYRWHVERERSGPRRGRLAYYVQVEAEPVSSAATPAANQLRSETERRLVGEQLLHIPGFGYDGLTGKSPIALARQSIGAGLAQEEYGARFWSNSAIPAGGYLKTEKGLSDKAYARLESAWNRDQSGSANAWSTRVLEEGLSWQTVALPQDDAQFLDTIRANTVIVARFFRMPLHKIGHLDDSKYANIEAEQINFTTDTILPYLPMYEQELTRKLISPEERAAGIRIKYDLDALLRGEPEKRHRVYALGRQWGYYSANDVLELEDRNPIGAAGDLYLVPVNMITADRAARDSEEPIEPTSERQAGAIYLARVDERAGAEYDAIERQLRAAGAPILAERAAADPVDRELRSIQARTRLRESYRGLFERDLGRLVRREAGGVRKLVRRLLDPARGASEFSIALSAFYQGHESIVADTIRPVVSSYAGEVAAAIVDELELDEAPAETLATFVEGYAGGLAGRWTASSRVQLETLLEGVSEADAAAAIEERLAEWEETRARRNARRETVREGEGVSRVVYIAAGALALIWKTVGKTCPLCLQLAGKRISTSTTFVPAGGTVDPADGITSPITVKRAIGHPPLHGGCDCFLTPGF